MLANVRASAAAAPIAKEPGAASPHAAATSIVQSLAALPVAPAEPKPAAVAAVAAVRARLESAVATNTVAARCQARTRSTLTRWTLRWRL